MLQYFYLSSQYVTVFMLCCAILHGMSWNKKNINVFPSLLFRLEAQGFLGPICRFQTRNHMGPWANVLRQVGKNINNSRAKTMTKIYCTSLPEIWFSFLDRPNEIVLHWRTTFIICILHCFINLSIWVHFAVQFLCADRCTVWQKFRLSF